MVQKRKTQNPLIKCDEKFFGTFITRTKNSKVSFKIQLRASPLTHSLALTNPGS